MRKEEWRLLQTEYRNPFLNLALEEGILRLLGEGVLPNTVRLWTNPNTIVLGRFQSPELEVNFPACERYGTQIVRRLTGGGAVYHDLGNLNFSIFLTRTHRLAQDNIMGVFQAVGSTIVAGLRELGLAPEFKSSNTVHLDGRKISGMAGTVKWGAILVHGTLLVGTDLEILRQILDAPPIQPELVGRYIRSVKTEVTSLQERIGGIRMDEVCQALITEFERTSGIHLHGKRLTRKEEVLAQRLYEEKYGTPRWNLQGVI